MVMPPIVTSSKRPRVNCRTSSGASKRFKTTSTVGPGEIISVLPNGSRLSCGAELECSQTEFYNTACKTFSRSVEDGRRQLQALVRRRKLSRWVDYTKCTGPHSTKRCSTPMAMHQDG